MSTNTAPAAPVAIRRELQSPRHSYELSLATEKTGAWLHVSEGSHDAALALVPAQVVELRADLATILIHLGHGLPLPGVNGAIRSPAGVAIVEHIRQAFLALIELDKVAPHEVDAIATVIVSHVRAWRPIVLLEVAGG